jgi:hypothetical protein
MTADAKIPSPTMAEAMNTWTKSAWFAAWLKLAQQEG